MCGAYVGPLRIQAPTLAVSIFPLHSWYHGSWDTEPDVHEDSSSLSDLNFQNRWSDFFLCKWPADIISEDDFTRIPKDGANSSFFRAFSLLNEPFLTPASLPNNTTVPSEQSSISNHSSPLVREEDTVISFSHFVTRKERVDLSVMVGYE